MMRLLLCWLFLLISPFSQAAQINILEEATIFSGPSRNFRPLRQAKKGETLIASETIYSGRSEDFYQVQLFVNGRGKQVGFLPTSANVQMTAGAGFNVRETNSRSDLNETVVASLSSYANQNYLWTAEYNRALSPGILYHFYIGQWLQLLTSSGIIGGGISTERALTRSFVGAGKASLGYVVGSGNDAIYPGMRDSNSNLLLNLVGGIKYSTNQYASIGAGLSFANLTNGSGSFSSTGILFSMEIGLP